MSRSKLLTDEIFTDIVQQSISIREVINKMGLVPAGGNYLSIKKRISRLDISISHFVGQAWNKGNHTPRRSIEDYLSNKYPIKSHNLKNLKRIT